MMVFTLAVVRQGAGDELKSLTLSMRLQESEWEVMRKRVLPGFERQCGCRVKASDIPPEGLAKILEAMARTGRMKIDVFAQDNMRLAELVESRLVQDLSTHERRIPPEVLSSMVEAGRFHGKLYFMPYRPNVQIAYYNGARFRQYGLKPPRSWEELREVARRLKEREGIGRVLFKGWGGTPTSTLLYEWILSAGGDPLSLKHPGTVRTFQFLQELWPDLSPDSRRAKWDTTNQFLAQESVYLAQNWPFGVRLLVKEYGKTEIKTYSGWRGPVREAHVVGGEVLGIPVGAPQTGLALDLIRYMQSREVQETFSSALAWPSIRGDAYGEVEAWMKPHFQAVMEALGHGVFRKNVPYWAEFERIINEAFIRTVVERQSVDEILNVLHKRLEAVKAGS